MPITTSSYVSTWARPASLATRLLFIAAIAFWYAPIMPDIPRPQLDSGWKLGLAIACERGFVFGVDMVFTYGPFGCYATWQYWPSIYWGMLVFWTGVGGLAAGLLFQDEQSQGEAVANLAGLWWLGTLGTTMDTALLALPLAYCLNAYRTGRRSVLSVVALVWLAAIALSKFTMFPVCFLAVALAPLLRRDSAIGAWLVDVLCFTAFVAIAWRVAAGQPWTAFVPYLSNSFEVARGYPAAMALPDGRNAWETFHSGTSALWIAASAAALIAISWRRSHEEPSSAVQRYAWLLFLTAVSLVVFRQSTVRGDDEHLYGGLAFVGGTGLLMLRLLKDVPGTIVGSWLLATFILFLSIVPSDDINISVGSLKGRITTSISGVVHLLRGNVRNELDSSLADARQKAIAASGRKVDDKTFDVLGQDQHLLLGMPVDRWRPRPVLQSYSAYTDKLSRINADSFANGPRRDVLAFQPKSIGGRMPSQDDALLWPMLKKTYAPVGDGMWLERRADPVIDDQTVSKAQATGDNWIDVPPLPGGTVYAAVSFDVRLGDRLRGWMWKPPAYFIELRLTGTSEARSFRIVPEITASGFLLSPLIETPEQLEHWINGDAPVSRRVTALRVVDAHGNPMPTSVSLSNAPFR